jgi:UDP-glucose 4-epimerase
VKRALVTGGSGFVGRALVEELAVAGWDVVATSTRTWDAARTDVPDVDWSAVDTVVHLAAPTGTTDEALLRRTVVDATDRLLEGAEAAGVGRFVYVSSGDALGAADPVADEDTAPQQAASAYGAAKAAAESATLAHDGLMSMSTAVVRLFHPYGPGGDRFLVNRAVKAVAEGTPFRVEGNDGLLLNPVWVADVGRGLRLAAESRDGGVFHLAGPDLVSLRGLLELTGELCGRDPVIEHVDGTPPGGHAGRFERTTRLLGYRPGVPLRDGIGRLLRSFAAPKTGC